MASNEFSLKIPPKMDKEGDYETWKSDLKIWRRLTDLEKPKQALVVHLRLEGRARIASSELGEDILGKADGLDKLLEKLDSLFLRDKSTRQYSAFRELYKLSRKGDQSVEHYITEFEQVAFKMAKLEMTLPQAVGAFLLLESSNLSDNEVKMVMSGMKEVTVENMKESMLRILGGKFGCDKNLMQQSVKEEPIFENEAFYSKNNNYRGKAAGNKDNWAQSSFRGSRSSSSWGANRNNNGEKKINPTNRYGKPTKCAICGSIYHWAKFCPHAEESSNNSKYKTAANSEDDNEVHFSLFVGYNGTPNDKLNRLVDECQGFALLDSGCTKTVAGEAWLSGYTENLSDYDKSFIKEQDTNSSFSFGDGRIVKAIKKVTLPCYIDNKRSTIETDIVKCDIPLLLSRKSMKNGRMILNFENDTVVMGGNTIKLNSTKSGHYLLPLVA